MFFNSEIETDLRLIKRPGVLAEWRMRQVSPKRSSKPSFQGEQDIMTAHLPMVDAILPLPGQHCPNAETTIHEPGCLFNSGRIDYYRVSLLFRSAWFMEIAGVFGLQEA